MLVSKGFWSATVPPVIGMNSSSDEAVYKAAGLAKRKGVTCPSISICVRYSAPTWASGSDSVRMTGRFTLDPAITDKRLTVLDCMGCTPWVQAYSWIPLE